jgi:hypothetical protein
MAEWRKRKRGTVNQVGQSFVVAPSRQKLKQRLPTIADLGRMPKENHERFVEQKGEKALEKLDEHKEIPEEKKLEIEKWIYEKYFPQEGTHIKELKTKIEENRPHHWHDSLFGR